MLVLAFIVSGLCEVGGVWLVLRDLRRERRAALALITGPVSEPVELNESTIRKYPGSMAMRKRLLEMERDSSADGQLTRSVLIDLLRTDRSRLWGPGLVTIGIVIGTAANIAAID